jgi:DNA-binding NtrC family response regulator
MTSDEASVYVVDDDDSAREAIVGAVRAGGYKTLAFRSAPAFLAHPRRSERACLVLDVEMPDVSGLDLQERLNAANDALPIIFVTGYADVPMSVTALKAGAVDFLTKPFDAGALIGAVQRALAQAPERKAQSERRAPVANIVDGIVGNSPALRTLLRQVKTVAATDTTVLIQGETGTGKERIARVLHDSSPRSGGGFIKVNCAAIPAGLIESELMGHERGAFTGAVAQRVGRFELAQNGTIFLDEIGELPLELQPKLLRILQEREFERVGSTRTVRANARVIAATNRDLRSMVAARQFREDLFYRLSVFPLHVPPLRERMQDVPVLATHFMREIGERMGKELGELSPLALARLSDYHYPGNIRELQNIVERAVILSEDGTLEIPVLSAAGSASADPAELASSGPGFLPRSEGLAAVSKAHILRVLNETNWVVAGPNGAAARLEMKRSTLNFRMRKLGIVRPR